MSSEVTGNGARHRKKCIVVCGPTASGKSVLADGVAEAVGTNAMLVDSMQVYREIPSITNQKRDRPAHLCGIVSITDTWSVANHRDAALEIPDKTPETPIILDAGTGMYLNAILLDIDLAPKVEKSVRRASEKESAGSVNPRREVRRRELERSGGDRRGSIWEGPPRFDTHIVYLKPDRDLLDSRIAGRSRTIASEGLDEARFIEEAVSSGLKVNAPVSDSIGVRELRAVVRGEMSLEEATEKIATRTRQLSRRQMTWFDKLARSSGSLGMTCTTLTDYRGGTGRVISDLLHGNG